MADNTMAENSNSNSNSNAQSTSKHGAELVLIRNQFYWEGYKKIVVIMILLLLLTFMLFGFIIYLYKTPVKPKYFATTPDGVPIKIVPYNLPYQTNDFVMNWAKKVVVSIYSFDFLTYRKTLQDNAQYFTWLGHANFLTGIKASNNLEAVKAKKQVVSVEVTGPVTLRFAGLRDSDQPYSWDLSFPATFTYQNSVNDIVKQAGTFYMTIVRDSTLRYPDGIAISTIVFEASFR